MDRADERMRRDDDTDRPTRTDRPGDILGVGGGPTIPDRARRGEEDVAANDEDVNVHTADPSRTGSGAGDLTGGTSGGTGPDTGGGQPGTGTSELRRGSGATGVDLGAGPGRR
jgi:hypothetical protein